MEEIMGKLHGFTISGEDDILVLDDEWVFKGKNELRPGLVGRLLSKKHVRFDIFQEIF